MHDQTFSAFSKTRIRSVHETRVKILEAPKSSHMSDDPRTLYQYLS